MLTKRVVGIDHQHSPDLYTLLLTLAQLFFENLKDTLLEAFLVVCINRDHFRTCFVPEINFKSPVVRPTRHDALALCTQTIRKRIVQSRRRSRDLDIIAPNRLMRSKVLIDMICERNWKAWPTTRAASVAQSDWRNGYLGDEVVQFFLNQAVLGCGEGDQTIRVGDGVVGVCFREAPGDGELVGVGMAAGGKRHLDEFGKGHCKTEYLARWAK